ncbi:unnamed protein product [Paramecium pentaurelia]|uniref:DNA/RNA-binding protein Alba-like domain-containing protein n=1 Tax=Paramecium pentaurelia TaxID=43138 RepID=A0A8S1W5G5_9CILI|nr:unnamed protein product [Paramecium pentaurelia]
MAQRESSDIMIKSKSSQDQIAEYLVKAVLLLRDRENQSESVRLFGCGKAIPNVILVAEIIRARFKGLSSITTLENLEQQIEENGVKSKIYISAIRIKLTCNPSQEELQQPGYQAPGDVKDDKKFELFQYVMIYTKNLFFLRGENRQRQYKNQSQQNEKVGQSYEGRGELKSRGNAQVQRRKPDQPEYNENQKRDQQKITRPKPQYNQSNSNFQQKNSGEIRNKQVEIRTKQGEIRTRGGNRK